MPKAQFVYDWDIAPLVARPKNCNGWTRERESVYVCVCVCEREGGGGGVTDKSMYAFLTNKQKRRLKWPLLVQMRDTKKRRKKKKKKMKKKKVTIACADEK